MTGPERWGKVPLSIAVDLGRDHTATALYCVLAAHANRIGECWPSQSTLGVQLGASRWTIGRAVGVLADRGHVVVLSIGKGRTPTHYLLPALVGRSIPATADVAGDPISDVAPVLREQIETTDKGTGPDGYAPAQPDDPAVAAHFAQARQEGLRQ